jgi:hypothetical protein
MPALRGPAFTPDNTRKPGAKEIAKNSKKLKCEHLKKIAKCSRKARLTKR